MIGSSVGILRVGIGNTKLIAVVPMEITLVSPPSELEDGSVGFGTEGTGFRGALVGMAGLEGLGEVIKVVGVTDTVR